MPLTYKIDVLQALKDKGYTLKRIHRERLLGNGTIQKLRLKQPVAWGVLEKLCEILDCQPDDFVEYVSDDNKK